MSAFETSAREILKILDAVQRWGPKGIHTRRRVDMPPPPFAEVLCRCQPPGERIYAPSVWAQVWDKWRESGKQAVKSVVWLAIEADRTSAISAE